MNSLAPSLKELRNYHYVTTWEGFLEVVETVNLYLRSVEKPRLALDLETYWLVPQPDPDAVPRPIKQNGMIEGLPRTVQIGLPPTAGDVQYVIDVKLLEEQDPANRKRIGDLLRPILEYKLENESYIPIYGQNLQYEFEFMFVVYNIRLHNMKDTMYIRAVLQSGDKTKKKSLAVLYDEFLPPHFFKAYTGMYQHEYEDFKHKMQTSNWKAEELTDDQIRYAADDVSKLIFELYDQMVESNEEKSVDAFIAKYEKKNNHDQSAVKVIALEWKNIPIYGGMGVRGIKFDKEYHLGTVVPFLEKIKEEQEAIVGKYFTKEVQKSNGERGKKRKVWKEKEIININAWQQALPALKSIGIDLPNYQEETLLEAQREHDHEVLDAIISFKKVRTILSNFGYSILDHVRSDGRIYPSWNQLGTGTGRATCTLPNLTTIPIRDEIGGVKCSELARRSFIPRSDDYVILDADYSQIEPRTMADVCKDKVLLAAYSGEDEIDRHSFTAQLMFGLDYLPDENDPYRAAGKEFNLGSTYGMGLQKSMKKINSAVGYTLISDMNEMKEKRDAYFGALKGLTRYKKKMEQDLRVAWSRPGFLKGCLMRDEPIAVLETVLGRPRRWHIKGLVAKEKLEELRRHPDMLDINAPSEEGKWGNTFSDLLNKVVREGFNHVAGQGTAADIFKQALVYVQEELDAQGFDFATEGIILTIYDEIVLEVRKENEEKAKKILKDCMIRAANDIIPEVYIKIGLKSGASWAAAH